jgi:TATA-box binding protein (TBP) (component of TFIID and TFIIIB)
MVQTKHRDRLALVADIDPGEFNVANKFTKLDASAYLLLAQITGNVPSIDSNGKLVLTGASQIGTKATDLAALWDKTTKIVKADINSGEFDVASKIPALDASVFLLLSQVVGNVPSLDATGKLVLTGTSQIGTKATDLAALWDKTTKIVKADIASGEFNVANKIPALDASIYLLLSQVVGNVPSLDANGKLVLTGASQIGTKATDLAALWDKTTKIVKADIDSGEFNVADKLLQLNAADIYIAFPTITDHPLVKSQELTLMTFLVSLCLT